MDNGSVRVERPQRFRDSMPRPLLFTFLALATATLVAVVVGLVFIPRGTVALEARRPPPRSVFTHDVGRITAAPLPHGSPPLIHAACERYANARFVAGGDGVAKLRAALAMLCPLAKGGLSADVTAAAGTLDGVTLEFGLFTATGVDSTTDLGARILWLNAKFALRTFPVEQLAPIVLHEAFHLIDPDAVITAERELRARAVELAACKNLVPIASWSRGCKDAEALLALPRARALALLVSAGYRAA